MVERLFLHIGHQKTGTSSLQSTLSANAGLLSRGGVLFPQIGHSHFDVAWAFNGRATCGPAREAMLATLAAAHQPVAVVSAENFVRLTGEQVEETIDAFRRVARRVTVLLYVRHPVACASSLVHQGVRHGEPLGEAVATVRALPLRRLVTRWRERVGDDDMIVRPFATAGLRNGDIVDDAMTVFGRDDLLPLMQRVRANESLSVAAIHLLDRANAIHGGRLPGERLRVFDRIGGPKYVIPEEALRRVAQAAVPELRFLKTRFGIELPTPAEAPSPPLDLPEETVDALARLLLEVPTDAGPGQGDEGAGDAAAPPSPPAGGRWLWTGRRSGRREP